MKRKCFEEESSDEEFAKVVYNDHSSDDCLCLESEEEKSAENIPKGGSIIANVYGKTAATARK